MIMFTGFDYHLSAWNRYPSW